MSLAQKIESKVLSEDQLIFSLEIFSKGKARSLRKNAKNGSLMSGTSGMLPAEFVAQPKSPRKRIHPSEKPVELFKEMLSYVAQRGEIVLDQFAGSFNLMRACLDSGYNCIAYELNKEMVEEYVS